MSSKLKAAKTAHPWSSDALLAKAQRYAQEMLSFDRDDWQFGLLSTFVLEFLLRAALARVSPTLLADAKDWNNTYFALGHSPKALRFLPKSIDTNSVLTRLRDILPDFTTELEGFSAQHISRRNEELHAGATPFDSLSTDWLSGFYSTAQVLLKSFGYELAFLVGTEEEEFADQLIEASRDKSAQAVSKAVNAHKTVWEAKSSEDKTKLERQASVWATRQAGHRVKCPACASDALIFGSAVTAPLRRLDGDLIIETQSYLPSKFECVACQLKIAGLSQLTACGLGASYKSTHTYDAAEYYAPEEDYQGYDDDNNEP